MEEIIKTGDARPLTFIQRKFNHRTEFDFGDDALTYHAKLGGTETTKEIPYQSINMNAKDHRTQSNKYFQNVGVYMLIFGAAYAILAPSIFAPCFLALGAGFLIYYYATRFGFSVYPSNSGNVLVFDGTDRERIIEELRNRRVAVLRKQLSPVNYRNTKAGELAKYDFLKKEKAISDVEYDLYVAEVNDDASRFIGP